MRTAAALFVTFFALVPACGGGGGGSGGAYFDRFAAAYCQWTIDCGKSENESHSACIEDLRTEDGGFFSSCPETLDYYAAHSSEMEACLTAKPACGRDKVAVFCPTADWDGLETKCRARRSGGDAGAGPVVVDAGAPVAVAPSTFSYKKSGDASEVTYKDGGPEVATMRAGVSASEITVAFAKTDASGFSFVTKGATPKRYTDSDGTFIRNEGSAYVTDGVTPSNVTITSVGALGEPIAGTFEITVKLSGCTSCASSTYLGAFSITRR